MIVHAPYGAHISPSSPSPFVLLWISSLNSLVSSVSLPMIVKLILFKGSDFKFPIKYSFLFLFSFLTS